jgi:hypothetical protein
MENKQGQIYYESFDKVKLFDGDNFYFLVYDNIMGKVIYTIKFWDCNVMENFTKNRPYLKNKRLFSNKTVLKEYIIKNELNASNFDLIFVE